MDIKEYSLKKRRKDVLYDRTNSGNIYISLSGI